MNKLTKTFVAIATLIFASASVASTLSIPKTFSSGDTTSAADMNANFTAVKAAVDDNNTRITALQASSAPVFQGFSGTADASGGIRVMQAACDAAFSGSKICTSVEFSNSTYTTVTLSTGPAWLLPVLQQTGGVENSSSGTDGFVTDQASGLTANTNNPAAGFTCGAYHSDGARYTGLTVSNTGMFAASSCDTARPVACCK